MKKILLLALALLSLFLFASCGKEEGAVTGDSVTLYVYNWGEYISDGSEDSVDSNKEFEAYCRETLGMNVKVNYSTYSSNEDLYAKLSSGAVSYDVIVPSDYMIARLADEGLLLELNPKQTIPNYAHILDRFKGLYYDPDEVYSIPYTYGTVGVIYNAEIVDEEDIGSWDLMWNEKYSGNILQFNNPRDAFATALFSLGYSLNSANPDEWREALELLKTEKDVVQGYVMDEIFNKMQGGSAAVASYYAGDFFTMYSDNDRLAFYYPEEGANVFVDGLCIPACSKNPDLAREYINFMLSKEIAIANAEYICYASPLDYVATDPDYIAYMTEEVHEDAMEILYEYPADKMEYFHDLGAITYVDENGNEATVLTLMNDLWESLKIESTIGTGVFVICGVIVGTLVGGLVFFFIRKRKRAKYY